MKNYNKKSLLSILCVIFVFLGPRIYPIPFVAIFVWAIGAYVWAVGVILAIISLHEIKRTGEKGKIFAYIVLSSIVYGLIVYMYKSFVIFNETSINFRYNFLNNNHC